MNEFKRIYEDYIFSFVLIDKNTQAKNVFPSYVLYKEIMERKKRIVI